VRSCLRALQRREHPVICGSATQPFGGCEQPALEAEVAARFAVGLDVLTVDAHGRRAKKALAVGGVAWHNRPRMSCRAWLAGMAWGWLQGDVRRHAHATHPRELLVARKHLRIP
jgi:hypothetical protein